MAFEHFVFYKISGLTEYFYAGYVLHQVRPLDLDDKFKFIKQICLPTYIHLFSWLHFCLHWELSEVLLRAGGNKLLHIHAKLSKMGVALRVYLMLLDANW
jgi:hypothetical protein